MSKRKPKATPKRVANTDKFPDRLVAVAPVFEEMAESGLGVRAACERVGAPSWSTVKNWLADAGHEQTAELLARYARARELRADWQAEQLLQIADTPQMGRIVTENLGGQNPGTSIKVVDMVEHRRLQVDARKWLLAKMFPSKYGDKVTQEITGGDKPVGLDVTDERRAKVDEVFAKFGFAHTTAVKPGDAPA
jgi:hypothetical protein